MKSPLLAFLLVVMLVLASLVIWPTIDLTISGWFYTINKGFLWAEHPFFLFMHRLAYDGARALGVAFVLLAVTTALLRKPLLRIDSKGWFFLFLALVIGPGLVANIVLKDHWGRARPREITEFGGTATFSPPLILQKTHHKNDSFVAGDAAFGFYLTSFAYLLPLPSRGTRRNYSRRFFWGGMAMGTLFGISRIVMGGHFFSDVLFAAFFMLVVSAGLHAIMFRRQTTAIYWRNWFFADGKKEVTSG